MQATKLPLSNPLDYVERTYGRYNVRIQRTVDDGYSICTMSGPHHETLLSYSTPDLDVARIVWAVIQEGGRTWQPAEDVLETLKATLTQELHRLQRRRDTPSINRVEHINRLLDRMDSPADREALAVLAGALKAVA